MKPRRERDVRADALRGQPPCENNGRWDGIFCLDSWLSLVDGDWPVRGLSNRCASNCRDQARMDSAKTSPRSDCARLKRLLVNTEASAGPPRAAAVAAA